MELHQLAALRRGEALERLSLLERGDLTALAHNARQKPAGNATRAEIIAVIIETTHPQPAAGSVGQVEIVQEGLW